MDESIKINILNNEIVLDEICWDCKNKFPKVNLCTHCSKTGYILTEQGEAIMELVSRHLSAIK